MPSAQSELASLCKEFLLEETVLLSCPDNSVLSGSVFTWSSDRKQCQVPHGLHWKLPRPPKSPRYWILCSGNSAMAQVSLTWPDYGRTSGCHCTTLDSMGRKYESKRDLISLFWLEGDSCLCLFVCYFGSTWVLLCPDTVLSHYFLFGWRYPIIPRTFDFNVFVYWYWL